MILDSPHWDQNLGVCTKHSVPQVPCPACLAGDGDEDLQIRLTETDRLYLDFGDSLTDAVPENLIPRLQAGTIEVF